MNRLLLDTHTLLWWLTDDPALSTRARDEISDPAHEPLVSTATVWEIAIQQSLGKITAPDDLPDRIAQDGFGWLPVSAAHAWQVRELPLHHRDPFDRLLVAQAAVEGIPLITKDPRLSAYDIETRW